MSDFYPGVTVQELVPGNPAVLFDLVTKFQTLAGGLDDATSELSAIDAGQWAGTAADAFKTVVHQQPGKYKSAASAFTSASSALQQYAEGLETAQGAVSYAISLWEEGTSKSSAWQQAQAAGPVAGAIDPGEDLRAEAEARLGHARGLVNQTAATFMSVVREASASAPHRPSLLDDLAGAVDHLPKIVEGVLYFETGLNFRADVQFVEGIGLGAWQMVGGLAHLGIGLWDISPQRMLIDPTGWFHSVTDVGRDGGAMYDAASENPAHFFETLGSNLINLHEWERDPAKAFGELIPGIALAVVTAGAGTAADGAAETAADLSSEADSFDALAGAEADAGASDATVATLDATTTELRTEAAESAAQSAKLTSVQQTLKAVDNANTAEGTVQALNQKPGHTLDGEVASEGAEKVTVLEMAPVDP